jgi:predicted transcriptional regulator YheO
MRILVDEKREVHPYLDNMKSVAEGICKFLGKEAEVVLHDLSQPEESIIFIAGDLTEREIGGPITDIGLKRLRDENNPDDVLNYKNELDDGRILKSSTMFVTDDDGQVLGCLCVNYNITNLYLVENTIRNFCVLDEQNKDNQESDAQHEIFADNINDVMAKMLSNAIKEVDKPILYMEKNDKIKIIEYLDTKGAFMIKGAVDHTAEKLNVSRYTIYNYLKEVDNNK